MRRKSKSKPKRPLSAKAQLQQRRNRARAARKGWVKRRVNMRIEKAVKAMAANPRDPVARAEMRNALKVEDMINRGFKEIRTTEDEIVARMTVAREENRWHEEMDEVIDDYDLDYGEFWDIVDYEETAA